MAPLARSRPTAQIPLPACVSSRVTGTRKAQASQAASRSVDGESGAPATVAAVTDS